MARAYSIYVIINPDGWVDEVWPFTVKHEAQKFMLENGLIEEFDDRCRVIVYEDGTGKIRQSIFWSDFVKGAK
jgi:hypothetical protein